MAIDRQFTRIPCEECDDGEVICPMCNGCGISKYGPRPDDYGPHMKCLHCGGSGAITCEECDGAGWVEYEEEPEDE